MNLRTITFWGLYDPANKAFVVMRQFKREVEKQRRRYPERLVVVKMKGHYLSRPPQNCEGKT